MQSCDLETQQPAKQHQLLPVAKVGRHLGIWAKMRCLRRSTELELSVASKANRHPHFDGRCR